MLAAFCIVNAFCSASLFSGHLLELNESTGRERETRKNGTNITNEKKKIKEKEPRKRGGEREVGEGLGKRE